MFDYPHNLSLPGPNGIVLFPVNSDGKSCDLNGEPFPALSDGRPCWPCNAEGQPIAADGKVVNVGPDGYPIDLKGRLKLVTETY